MQMLSELSVAHHGGEEGLMPSKIQLEMAARIFRPNPSWQAL